MKSVPARTTRVALIGDRNATVVAHQAIPKALELVSEVVGHRISGEWVPTEGIEDDARVDGYDGLWCVPASPYRSTSGALHAIRFARENGRPFLGTCGGFQHAVLEYARHVLRWFDASHAEIDPAGSRSVIAPLSCSLVEISGRVRLHPGSRIARAYGSTETHESYHCSYGLNPAFRAELASGPLTVTATDEDGDVRAVELSDHPFFVATLFQPERAALEGRAPPLVAAFAKAAALGGRSVSARP